MNTKGEQLYLDLILDQMAERQVRECFAGKRREVEVGKTRQWLSGLGLVGNPHKVEGHPALLQVSHKRRMAAAARREDRANAAKPALVWQHTNRTEFMSYCMLEYLRGHFKFTRYTSMARRALFSDVGTEWAQDKRVLAWAEDRLSKQGKVA